MTQNTWAKENQIWARENLVNFKKTGTVLYPLMSRDCVREAVSWRELVLIKLLIISVMRHKLKLC